MCRAGVALVANHEDDAVPIVLVTSARHGSCAFGRVTEQDVLPIDAFDHHEMAVPIVIDECDSRHAALGELVEREAETVGTEPVFYEIAFHVEQGEADA